jgi:hypothetical protein
MIFIVGLKTKIFILIPLSVFSAIILGFGMYNTLCKNSNLDFLGC